MPDLEAIQAFISSEHTEFARRVSDFAAHELRPLPHPTSDDDGRRQARQVLAKMGTAKLFEPVDPLDLTACCLARETIAAASTLADDVFALQALGSRPVALAGSDQVKRRYLPGVANGELMAAFAMTEPTAGSDVAAIKTRAEKHADGYTLNGEKTLISNAGIADFYTVFASSAPELGVARLNRIRNRQGQPWPRVRRAPGSIGAASARDDTVQRLSRSSFSSTRGRRPRLQARHDDARQLAHHRGRRRLRHGRAERSKRR